MHGIPCLRPPLPYLPLLRLGPVCPTPAQPQTRAVTSGPVCLNFFSACLSAYMVFLNPVYVHTSGSSILSHTPTKTKGFPCQWFQQ